MVTSYTGRLGTAPEEAIKAPCVVASLVNITLSGEQTIGSTAVVAGDRVLVAAQTDNTENGIYDAAAGAWSRSTDWNESNDVISAQLVFVPSGLYEASFTGSYSPGTTALTFAKVITNDFWTSKTSPTRIAIDAQGVEVGYFRHDGSDAVFSLDSTGTEESTYPVFEVNERFSRPKTLARSLLLGDPGDTAEIGFRDALGTPAVPTSMLAGRLNSLIYWVPRDSAGNHIPIVDAINLPLAGTGPFYGRIAQIHARPVEAPTNLARGGALVFETTKIGEVALRQRMWISNKGYVVIGGYGSYEARGTESGGASTSVYPDTTAERFTPADGLERGVGGNFSGVQGDEDSWATPGFAPLSHVMTDEVLGPFISYHEYDNDNVGMDIDWDTTDGEIQYFRVQSPNRTRVKFVTFKLSTGTIALGDNNTFRALPVSSGVNGLDVVGSATGNSPQLSAQGTDTNIPVRLTPKGTGGVELMGSLKFSGTPQALVGAGGVDITSPITEVDTTGGAAALTLADGSPGQHKEIVMITDAGAGTLTPTSPGNYTTIVFDDVGDSALLLFTNSAWHFMGGTATLT